jgi:4'-phosphopantetheinyl transferase
MIPRNEIHVWFASADESGIEVEGDFSFLPSGEQRRARQLRFGKNRTTYVLGKYVIRTLLARTLHLPPQAIEFVFNKYGKPALVGDGGVTFSLAHSDKHVICALAANRDVGVDIEAERTDIDFIGLARQYFCAGETRNLEEASSCARRGHLFYKYWTLKEAYLKAEGSGLNVSLTAVDTSEVPDDCPGTPCAPVEDVLRGILVQRLEAPLGYAAAVAATGGIWTTKTHRWRAEEFLVAG